MRKPISLIYVDDDAEDRRVFRTQIATHLGNPVYYLQAAEDLLRRIGPEAEERIPEPGIILVDLVLPGMSGYELVRTIRQDYKHLDLTPLIVVTGSYDDASIKTAEEVGADAYIGKPMTVFSLMSVLKGIGRYELEIVDRRTNGSVT